MMNINYTFTTAILVLAALAVHEAAHILTANYLGARVEKVRPFILGFSAKINGLENLLAWERYVIYAAGVAANGILAAWAVTASRISYVGVPWLDELAFYSLVLCIFNLLPALPLDGGRLFAQFWGNRLGIGRANKILVILGKTLGITLILLGIAQIILFDYNITLFCAGVYIWKKNKNIKPELQMQFYRAIDGKAVQERARQMPTKIKKVRSTMPVKRAMTYLTLDHHMEFHLQNNKKEHVSSISENTLLMYVFDKGINGTLEDILLLMR